MNPLRLRRRVHTLREKAESEVEKGILDVLEEIIDALMEERGP